MARAASSAGRRPALAATLLALVLGFASAGSAPALAGLRGFISESDAAHGQELGHDAVEEDHGHGSGGHHGEEEHGHGSHGNEGHETEEEGHGDHGSGGHETEEEGHGDHGSGGHDSDEEVKGHHGGGGSHRKHSHRKHFTSTLHGEASHGHIPHGVHEVSSEERSIGYLMMFAVAAAMVLLLFINYKDPDVRCASSKMACTAVSVYCAVLVNQAVFSFLFDQVLMGKDFRGFGMKEEDVKPWMRGLIGGLIFIQTLAGLNIFCWRWKHRPNRLVAASQLGAHLVAWAGINAFGSLSNSDVFHNVLLSDLKDSGVDEGQLEANGTLIKYIAVIILGFITFILIFQLSRVLRMKLVERASNGYARLGGGDKKREVKKVAAEGEAGAGAGAAAKGKAAKPAPKAKPAAGKAKDKKLAKSTSAIEEPEHQEHWLEELADAEHEAMALVLGFLTQQTVVYMITRKVHIPIHGLHGKRDFHEVMMMMACAWLTFGLLLVVSVVWRVKGRSSFNFRGWLAMTMAWLFERSGEWFMHFIFDNLAFARMWSAFVLTGFSIFCIIFIDHFADGTKDRKKRSKVAKTVTLEELVALDKLYELQEAAADAAAEAATAEPPERSEASDASEDAAPAAAPSPDGAMPEQINGIALQRLEELQKDLKDETPTDLSVQTLSLGFSVLIGIVWDMAFESAEEIIVSPGQATFKTTQMYLVEHPVLARCGLAVLLCAIVLPGWVFYIVPPARKAWRHHLEDILLAQRQVPSKNKHKRHDDSEDEDN